MEAMCPPSSELPLCYPVCPRPLGPANKLHHTVLGLRDPFPVTLQKKLWVAALRAGSPLLSSTHSLPGTGTYAEP